MSAAISVEGLTRRFVVRRKAGRVRRVKDVVTAVDAISFDVAPGEAVGYIGANGAGKSTTIKMVTGILVPTEGRIRTCGLEPVTRRRELARRIGVVFGQRSQLWWDLPLSDSLEILSAVHRLAPTPARARREELVERLDLGEFLSTPVRQLSLGQRMRGEVAAALLHRPELLILDEPTVGLDVVSKARLREFIGAEQAAAGCTVLLTTHDMGDIERICSRVLVVDHGRLVYDGALAGLEERVGARRVLVVDLAEPGPLLDDVPGTTLLAVEGDGRRQRLALTTDDGAGAALTAISRRARVQDLAVEEPAAEDVVRELYQSFAAERAAAERATTESG